MQVLEDAERYAMAGLFTLALHSTAARADGGGAGWGEPEEGLAPPCTDAGSPEIDAFWGRDLASRGGLLEAAYLQLGLPRFKWAGLLALPTVAPSSDSGAFHSAVRSLIAVLDNELAESLPALPRQGQRAPVAGGASSTDHPPQCSGDARHLDGEALPPDSPATPGARPVPVHDELWEGLFSSSEEESGGGGAVGSLSEAGVGSDEFQRDVEWEQRLEEQQRRRRHVERQQGESSGLEASQGSRSGRGRVEGTARAASPLAFEAQQVLQELSSPRVQGRQRSGDCASLAAKLEELSMGLQESSAAPDDVAQAPCSAAPAPASGGGLGAGDAARGAEQAAATHAPGKSQRAERAEQQQPAMARPEVSPIALAALWELLQCCVGAAAAAAEAARSPDSGACSEHGPRPSELRREGPPVLVRCWYDARSRVALGLVASWLQVPSRKLRTLEVLLGSDKAPVTVRPGTGRGDSGDRFRYLKVGLAAVGGGALFAVTGGLAAPAIAAGLGSLLGIVPGAAASAGAVTAFMSSQVGMAAVTGTMATAGAATTGSKMAYRTADVKEFGFVPVPEAAGRGGGALHGGPPAGPAQRTGSAASLPRTASEGAASTACADPRDPGHLTAGPSSSPLPASSTAGISRNASAASDRQLDASASATAEAAAGGGRPPAPSSAPSAASSGGAAPPAPSSASASASASSSASTWGRWFRRRPAGEEGAPLLEGPLRRGPASQGVKLSAVVCVSGWVSTPEDFAGPWRCVSAPHADKFALAWCTEELAALNSALGALLAKGAAGQVARIGVQHLLAAGAGLVAALGPTVALGSAAGMLIENAWTVALDRADKAGKLLAHVLMSGGAGGRPVTLLAHSVGARLVFSALLELCRRGARGLVQDVLLLGAPVSPTPELWRMARRVVAGRLVNGHSANDWLLSVMGWQGLARAPAGLAAVEAEGVENVALTALVGGHTEYLQHMGEILQLLDLP